MDSPEAETVYLTLTGELRIELEDGGEAPVRVPADQSYAVPRGLSHRVDPGEGCEYLRLDPAGASRSSSTGRIEVG
jgi:mannose-6-phosphate isomerase-like protein (cupin superfamily)